MLEAWDTVLGDTKHHWNRTLASVCLSWDHSLKQGGRTDWHFLKPDE